jgi:S1-C subfamily serine protease
MRRFLIPITLAGAIAVGTSASVRGQSPDERAAARDLIKKRGDAVVMVLATIKIRVNIEGRDQSQEQAAQTNATVIDSSGLAVLSLSTLEPDDVMSRQLTQRFGGNAHVDVTSEPTDIRMHLADGRELPAKLVLKDTDLDLAFVRPTEPLTGPMTFVDAPSGKASLLDLVFVVQRTSEATGWTTGASFGSVQLVIDKPRTYYLLAMSGGAAGFGSPLFDTSGKFVGITVMRNPGIRGAAPLSGVLPAEDIREVAKQAPGLNKHN